MLDSCSAWNYWGHPSCVRVPWGLCVWKFLEVNVSLENAPVFGICQAYIITMVVFSWSYKCLFYSFNILDLFWGKEHIFIYQNIQGNIYGSWIVLPVLIHWKFSLPVFTQADIWCLLSLEMKKMLRRFLSLSKKHIFLLLSSYLTMGVEVETYQIENCDGSLKPCNDNTLRHL